MAKQVKDGIKILGNGTLERNSTVQAHKFSKTAIENRICRRKGRGDLMEMLRTVAKAWNIPEIRKKIIFTLAMLVIFRIGAQVPVPGMAREILAQTFDSETGLFALFNLFSGGRHSNFTIFALSITPYITASIILQILHNCHSGTGKAFKRGAGGEKKDCPVYTLSHSRSGCCTGHRCNNRSLQAYLSALTFSQSL